MAAPLVTPEELDAILAVYTAHGTSTAAKWSGKSREWVRHKACDAGLTAGRTAGLTAEQRARVAPRYDCDCGSCFDHYANADSDANGRTPGPQLSSTTRRLKFVKAIIASGRTPIKLDLTADDAWQQHALCKGCDPAIWNPDSLTSDVTVAQQICKACPVDRACLQWANENLVGVERTGVWGGRYLTPRNATSTIATERAA